MPYVLEDSDEARAHVAQIEAEGYQHSLTGCPPFCRAMCRYAVFVEKEPVKK